MTNQEKTDVVTNCDHLKRLKFSPNLPYAFTEHRKDRDMDNVYGVKSAWVKESRGMGEMNR